MNRTKNTSLPKVQSRKEFIDHLESMISQPSYDDTEHSKGRPHELKTYIVESNNNFPQRFTVGNTSGEVIDTGVDKTKILRVSCAGNILEFFLDITDERFYTLHTKVKRCQQGHRRNDRRPQPYIRQHMVLPRHA